MLRASYSDPEGDRGNVDFKVRDAVTGEQVRWKWVTTGSGQVAEYQPGLPPGRYLWSARSWDGHDGCGANSAYGAERALTVNAPPDEPGQRLPGDGVRVTSSPRLRAYYSDDDGDVGGVDFRVFDAAGALVRPEASAQPWGPWQFSGDGAEGRLVYWTPTTLPSGTYSWDLRGWDGLQHSDRAFHSPRWSFTVNRVPGVPVHRSPTSGASFTEVPWLTARYADPEGDRGNVDFFIRDAAGAKPACITSDPVVMDNGGQRYASGTDVSYNPSCLPPGEYTWHTRAWDGLLSANSTARSFRVHRAPAAPSSPTPGTTDSTQPELTCDRTPTLSAGYSDADGDDGRVYFRLYDATTGAYAGGAGAGYGYGTPNPAASGTTVTFTPAVDLPNGKYQWRAYANDLTASSAYTAYRYFDIVCPGQPQQVTATKGDTQATVTWQPPPDGPLPVTGYQVRTYTAAGTQVGAAADLPETARSHTRTGLTNGTSYYFTVAARNAVALGEAARSSTVTPNAKPAVPSSPTPGSGDPAAPQLICDRTPTLSGGYSDADGDAGRVYFRLYDAVTGAYAGGAGVGYGYGAPNPAASGATVTFTPAVDLPNGKYQWRAYANDLTASSSYTAYRYFDIVCPGQPQQVTATKGDTQATVTWQPPPDGPLPVTGYRVRTYTAGGAQVGAAADLPETARSHTRTGLTNGAGYYFTVAARNAVALGEAARSSTVTPNAKPAVPSSPTPGSGDPAAPQLICDRTPTLSGGYSDADGDAGRVYFRLYDAVTGAYAGGAGVGYGYGAPNPAASGATVAFTPTANLPDGTYRWWAYANDFAASSGYSGSRYFTVDCAGPAAPQQVTAVAGDQQATVTWQAPVSVSWPVTGYRVQAFRAADDTAVGAAVELAATARSHRATGLANGVGYYFTVAARNAVALGEAARSNTVTPNAKPDVPPHLNPGGLDPIVPEQICSDRPVLTATYTDPDGDAGRIYFRLYDATTGASVGGAGVGYGYGTPNPAASGTVVSFTPAADLPNGQYKWRAYANDLTASSSDTAYRFFDIVCPGAPQQVQAVKGDTQATVAWQPPPEGPLPITGYRVRTFVAAGGAEVGQPVDLPETARSHTQPGLVNGTGYYFEVAARNAIARGDAARSNTVTPSGPPFAPTGVTATPGDTTATVTWTAAHPNGAALTDNVVQVFQHSDGAHLKHLDQPASGTATSATVDTLINGTPYTFRVVAANMNGKGPASNPATDPVTPSGPPHAPPGVTATPGDTTATVTWTAAHPNGAALTDNVVQVFQHSDGAHLKHLDQPASGTATSATVDTLTNGTAYTFRVVAANMNGKGPASEPTDPVTPSGLPFAPTGVAATSDGTHITVSWYPAEANGSALVGNRVEVVRDSDGERLTNLDESVSGTATFAAIDGLDRNTAYRFRVVASNRNGHGPSSEETVPTMPDGLLLNVSSPAVAYTTRAPEAAAQGRVAPGSHVAIWRDRDEDGQPDEVGAPLDHVLLSNEQRLYELMVQLETGANDFVVAATKAGVSSPYLRVPTITHEPLTRQLGDPAPEDVSPGQLSVRLAPSRTQADLQALVAPLSLLAIEPLLLPPDPELDRRVGDINAQARRLAPPTAVSRLTGPRVVTPGTVSMPDGLLDEAARWYGVEVEHGDEFRAAADLRASGVADWVRVQHKIRADQVPLPNDPRYPDQEYLTTINAQEAWDVQVGPGSVIAVIDKSFDIQHPDLSPNIVGEFRAASGCGDYIDHHGTAVAGVAGARTNNEQSVAGAAGYEPRLLPVTVGEPNDSTATCEYDVNAVTQGMMALATMENPPDAVNLSFSFGDAVGERAVALRMLHAVGVSAVKSAGNNGARGVNDYNPVHFAVAALQERGDALWENSNFGPEVSLSAPGVGIEVLSHCDINCDFRLDDEVVSGTSVAVPQAAATLALTRGLLPITGRAAELQVLDAASDFNTEERDNDRGDGNLDMGAALADRSTRLHGPNRNGTAAATVQYSVPAGAAVGGAPPISRVIVAPGDGSALDNSWRFAFPMASWLSVGDDGDRGGRILYSGVNQLSYETELELQRLVGADGQAGASDRPDAPLEIIIPGGPRESLNEAVEADLERYGTVRRLDGGDLASTAALIATERPIGRPHLGPNVFVARDDVFADSLAISPVLADLNRPLLYVSRDAVPEATCEYLGGGREDDQSLRIAVLGGEEAISPSVAEDLERCTNGAETTADEFTVIRIAGASRFETAARISDRFFSGAGSVVTLAQAWNWPDAGAAANLGAPVVLDDADDASIHPATLDYIESIGGAPGGDRIRLYGFALGGRTAMPESTEARFERALRESES